MARSYLAFGSDDKENWAQLETVVAGGATQALNLAKAQEAHRYYAVVPERNWTAGAPQDEQRPPVTRWQSLTPNQMRIDDDLDTHNDPVEEKEEVRNVL